MAITTYTTYADVRAALGVSDVELPDSTLALGLYSDSLDIELGQIAADLAEQFSDVDAIDAASHTAVQSKFMAATRLFSTYAVAVQLSSSLPLFAPKTVTDGKASFSRDSNSAYAETIKQCQANYSRLLGVLEAAYGSLVGSTVASVTRVFMIGAVPASDPVTGS